MMGAGLLRGKLLTEAEKACYLAGERYICAVGQCHSTGNRDPFWVGEEKTARAAWVEAARKLAEDGR